MKNKAIILGIIIVMGLLIAGFNGNKKSESVVAGDVINIAVPLSLTGTAATDGLSIKRGLDLAQQDLAEKGIKVNLAYEDDGTDPKRTVSAVKKIVSLSKPDAIVGLTWSFLLDSASGIVNNSKTVVFSPANTSEFVSAKGGYFFYGATKNAEKEQPIAKWLKQNNRQKVAIIVDKSNWGESNLVAFKKAIQDIGANIVYEEEILLGAEASTLPTSLAKISALHADVILTTGYDEGLTILINKTKEQKLNLPIVIASQIPLTLQQNGQIKVSKSDQIYIMTTASSNDFTSKFKAKYFVAPDNYADRAYDGLMLLVEAIRNKSKDESLKDYLHNKTNYAGYAATYKFDENGDIVGGDWIIEQLK